MKILYSPPYIGELGWELFCHQGYVRHLSKNFDKTIVGCRPGHEYLYSDFCSDFVFFKPETEETNMWINESVDKEEIDKILYRLEDQYNDINIVGTIKRRWWDVPGFKSLNQELIPLGKLPYTLDKLTVELITQQYDILLIVRNTEKCNTSFRNWDYNDAKYFAKTMYESGHKIACIGLTESAHHIPYYTTDLRGLTLRDLCFVMRNRAKVIVGTQCGPIHLASLCGLRQVTWQTKQEHKVRVEKSWNPFNSIVNSICAKDDSHWKNRTMFKPEFTPLCAYTTLGLN